MFKNSKYCPCVKGDELQVLQKYKSGFCEPRNCHLLKEQKTKINKQKKSKQTQNSRKLHWCVSSHLYIWCHLDRTLVVFKTTKNSRTPKVCAMTPDSHLLSYYFITTVALIILQHFVEYTHFFLFDNGSIYLFPLTMEFSKASTMWPTVQSL